MKYHKSNFGRESLILRRIPQNSIEAFNKLVCLREFDTMYNSSILVPCPSKRRERILKMYWAFRKMEAKKV